MTLNFGRTGVAVMVCLLMGAAGISAPPTDDEARASSSAQPGMTVPQDLSALFHHYFETKLADEPEFATITKVGQRTVSGGEAGGGYGDACDGLVARSGD